MTPTVAATVAIVIRRAVDADAASVQALIGRPPSTRDDHMTFVLTADGEVQAALDLLHAPDHLGIEAIAVAEAHRGIGRGRMLGDFAEDVARGMKLKEMRVASAIAPSPFFDKLGVIEGRKRLTAMGYLEAMGVPLFRDGSAPLGRSAYYRAVWASLAIISGVGPLSFAVFSVRNLTLALMIALAALCLAGALFALWQVGLIVLAARRHGWLAASFAVVAACALALGGIGYVLGEKAVPQLAELYSIHRGDPEFGGYRIEISPDGAMLRFHGPMGFGASAAAKSALDEHPSVQTVALDSPGGRSGEGLAMHTLFSKRKLNTHVEKECSSACTMAFVGGVRRTISTQGRLGFHQGGFPGMNATEMRDANRELETFMIRRGGVARDFAARVMATPYDKVWYPTHEELKAGNVIHAVSP